MLILALVLSIYWSSTPLQVNSIWKEVKPLVTTKSELEKKIGKGRGYFSILDYKYKKLIISVGYSRGKCVEIGDELGEWNVEKDTVLFFRMTLKKPVPIEKSPIDLTSFTRDRYMKDVLSSYMYSDDEKGLAVFTSLDGKTKKERISAIQVSPKLSEIHLKCKKKVE